MWAPIKQVSGPIQWYRRVWRDQRQPSGPRVNVGAPPQFEVRAKYGAGQGPLGPKKTAFFWEPPLKRKGPSLVAHGNPAELYFHTGAKVFPGTPRSARFQGPFCKKIRGPGIRGFDKKITPRLVNFPKRAFLKCPGCLKAPNDSERENWCLK